MAAVANLDQEIESEQKLWENKYLSDTVIQPLEVHHQMHLQILYGYSYQLLLLLHRPFFQLSITGQAGFESSRERCISAASSLLDLFHVLCNNPEYAPYKWYTLGLGCFHAFHAAVVLAVALPITQDLRAQKDIWKSLQSVIARFDDFAERSLVCAKAAPILRQLLSRVSTPDSEISLRPMSPNFPGSGALPHMQQTLTPDSNPPLQGTGLDGSLDGLEQFGLLEDFLEPNQWLSPAQMSWNNWDSILNIGSGSTSLAVA